MRGLMVAACLSCPVFAGAETFDLRLPVVAAEVFPNGALVVAEATLELPAGAHELHILMPPSIIGSDAPDVTGAVLKGTGVGRNTLYAPETFDLDAQGEARARLARAVDRHGIAERALRLAERKLSGIDASAEFLRTLGTGDTLPDPAAIAALVATMETELGRNAEARAVIEAELPALREALSKATAERQRAEAALVALEAPSEDWRLVTLSVEVDAPGPVTVRREFADFRAGWDVQYAAYLGESSVTFERSVALRKGGGLPWIDAAVTLSSAQPDGQTDATPVSRRVATIFDPEEKLSRNGIRLESEAAEAPVVAMAQDAGRATAIADFDGPVVRYSFPGPVTVLGGGDLQLIALSPLEAETDRYLAAAPRFDEHAYIMADFTNESGEVMLPGALRLYRADVLVGEGFLPLIAQGQEATLGFGPELTVALETVFVDVQTGDRGIIRGQSTREDRVILSAENTGPEAQKVVLRYAVPTSQQEDLEVRVGMDPPPSAEDVDDQIGVMEWMLTLAPGAREEITLDFGLRWPEGQLLNWRP
ncbi:MAG: mucoidy inhibitor MuiA family protein [Pseudomonadota bacterium]